jgi:hypothetical protein
MIRKWSKHSLASAVMVHGSRLKTQAQRAGVETKQIKQHGAMDQLTSPRPRVPTMQWCRLALNLWQLVVFFKKKNFSVLWIILIQRKNRINFLRERIVRNIFKRQKNKKERRQFRIEASTSSLSSSILSLFLLISNHNTIYMLPLNFFARKP